MHPDARLTLTGGTVFGGLLVAAGALTDPVLAETGAALAGVGLCLALTFDWLASTTA